MNCNIPRIKSEVTPCYSCGGNPREKEDKHDFYKCKIKDIDVILCDFCYADFPGHTPSYFGLKYNSELDDILKLESKTNLDNNGGTDLVCPKCNMRLVWQKTIQDIRKKISLKSKGNTK